jgi:ribosomal protein S21
MNSILQSVGEAVPPLFKLLMFLASSLLIIFIVYETIKNIRKWVHDIKVLARLRRRSMYRKHKLKDLKKQQEASRRARQLRNFGIEIRNIKNKKDYE